MLFKDLDVDTQRACLSAKHITDQLKKTHPEIYLKIVPKRIPNDQPKEYIVSLKALYDLDKSLFEKTVCKTGDSISITTNNPLDFSRSTFFSTVQIIKNYWAVNNGFKL